MNQWIEAFNAHDVAQIVALYTEDAELFDTGMKQPRRGRAEIERWFSTRFRVMPTIAYTPQAYLVGEGQAAVSWRASGHTPPLLRQRWLSRPFEVDGISLFTLRDDLIQQQHGFYDHLAIAERVLPPLRWLPLRL